MSNVFVGLLLAMLVGLIIRKLWQTSQKSPSCPKGCMECPIVAQCDQDPVVIQNELKAALHQRS